MKEKETENERKNRKKLITLISESQFKELSTIHMMQGHIHMMRGLCTCYSDYSNMQLVGHTNKQARVCLNVCTGTAGR